MVAKHRSTVNAEASIRKPNFFIPGAPKCGTTALAQWLAVHPDVYFSPRKEPHFFNRNEMPATRTLAEYEALFSAAGDRHKAVGEGSTHYLYSRAAVPRILDYSPEARFIVCLRNPVDMAPALHMECLRQGWETVRSFEAAWRLQACRRTGQRVPPAVRSDPERLQYGRYCRLGEQLERLYARVDRKRVLPVLLEDMRADPGREYRRVLDFLGLPDDGRSRFPVVNTTRQTRSVALSQVIRRVTMARNALGLRKDWGIGDAVRRLNSRRSSDTSLSPGLRTELRDYFADDIERLAALLGRDLTGWLEYPMTAAPRSRCPGGGQSGRSPGASNPAATRKLKRHRTGGRGG